MRKVVVSRQPLEFSWRNSELIDGDLAEAVAALKADAGVTGMVDRAAIAYRARHGVAAEDVALAVVVQRMVPAGRPASCSLRTR